MYVSSEIILKKEENDDIGQARLWNLTISISIVKFGIIRHRIILI